MAGDLESTVRRCIENYRMGAWCESIFYGCLIEIADDCPPERLWAALPEAVRRGLRGAVLDEDDWAQAEGLKETRGFKSLRRWLSAKWPSRRSNLNHHSLVPTA